MLSEGSDPANPLKQTFELNLLKKNTDRSVVLYGFETCVGWIGVAPCMQTMGMLRQVLIYSHLPDKGLNDISLNLFDATS